MNVITFGTFDCFHVGHLRIFSRIKSKYPYSTVIVGISSDELSYKKKGRYPIIPLEQRMEIIKSIRYVDQVFVEESLDEKADYLTKFKADVLVMGNDHEGSFDNYSTLCEVEYLERTPQISTTEIIEKINIS